MQGERQLFSNQTIQKICTKCTKSVLCKLKSFVYTGHTNTCVIVPHLCPVCSIRSRISAAEVHKDYLGKHPWVISQQLPLTKRCFPSLISAVALSSQPCCFFLLLLLVVFLPPQPPHPPPPSCLPSSSSLLLFQTPSLPVITTSDSN